jgi:UDP-N-acetylglucosamine 2-epimerase (non-hydrolysing)/GDP/UDP-N,N'-diacetylbacillosamine 2-epimerase (hydrolysing)
MRTIAVASVGRSDYSLLRPILRLLQADAQVHLRLVVSGEQAETQRVEAIRRDGFEVAAQVHMLLACDSAAATAVAAGVGQIGWAQWLAGERPDLLVLLGDRFETHAAASAAVPLQIPLVHIHGGELTLGAMDDRLRHSLTKLSHLHFVAHADFARRVMQMGEEPWRVHVTGAPGLDELRLYPPLPAAEFEQRFGFRLPPEFILATLHPLTIVPHRTGELCLAWLTALGRSGLDVVFTPPNRDPGWRAITEQIEGFLAAHPRSCMAPAWGPQGYYTAMAAAKIMVGNSSSGLIEAPSFGLPVVNVGDRQEGRLCPDNVVPGGEDAAAIGAAIERAGAPGFAAGLRALANPYGDGHAAERIVAVLGEVPLDERLLHKRFHDLARVTASQGAA